MNLADILVNLKGASDYNAAKRPSWNGYIKMEDYVEADPETETPESFKLKLVTGASTTPDATTTTTTAGTDAAAGTDDDVGTYIISYSNGAWTVPTGNSQLVIDAQLCAAIFADDWLLGLASEFETARASSGGRW